MFWLYGPGQLSEPRRLLPCMVLVVLGSDATFLHTKELLGSHLVDCHLLDRLNMLDRLELMLCLLGLTGFG